MALMVEAEKFRREARPSEDKPAKPFFQDPARAARRKRTIERLRGGHV